MVIALSTLMSNVVKFSYFTGLPISAPRRILWPITLVLMGGKARFQSGRSGLGLWGQHILDSLHHIGTVRRIQRSRMWLRKLPAIIVKIFATGICK